MSMQERLKREPDFEQFLKVLRREGTPSYLPFYEHIASAGFIATRTETDYQNMPVDSDIFLQTHVDFWLGLGFDCVPLERGLLCPLHRDKAGHDDALSHGSEASVVIRNREDFETYPWPDESAPINFEPFEKVAKLLPDGVKIAGGVCAGPYEWAAMMMGTIGMSYLMADDPELVGMVFEKIGSLHIAANRVLAQMDFIGAHRQGDDLGFKTSTFLPPDRLREWVFPTYKAMVDIAHGAGRPFILHSCGNLAEVYDDLADCGIDAKHSFEDVIMPVGEFKKQYGDRMTPVGGLDVDLICRGTKDEIRKYTIEHIEECWSDGYWALGTGNSLTDYMPLENYITVLETGLEVTR
jgi:uroporphyrinogen decarboxylase